MDESRRAARCHAMIACWADASRCASRPRAIAPASTPRCWPPPATPGAGERVLEAGCGVGAALLAAAARRPGARFVGVERDRGGAGARAGTTSPPTSSAERVDALRRRHRRGRARPPGRAVRRGALQSAVLRRSAGAARARIRPSAAPSWPTTVSAPGSASCVKAVRDGGTITLIHRADRLADMLALLGAKRRLVPGPADPAVRGRAGRTGARAGGARRQGAAAGCCRRWCCTTAAAPSTRPRPRRSCAARRTWHGSDRPDRPLSRRQRRRPQGDLGRPARAGRRSSASKTPAPCCRPAISSSAARGPARRWRPSSSKRSRRASATPPT